MSEMFLAEAAVAVVPDLTAFRLKLIRDLEVATSGVVAKVKVAATGATTAAAAATTAGRGAVQTAAAGTAASTLATRAQEESVSKLTAADKRLALAEKQVLATTSEVSAARIRLTAATRAVTLTDEAVVAAERAVATAHTAASAAALEAAQTANALTLTREREALATFNDAGAEKILTAERARGTATAAAQRSFATRGFAAQGLAAAGLRGAVLSANAAFLGGTVAAVAFGKAVASAAALESELNVFAVTAGATADQMERVSEEAQALGRDITLPGVTAGDAAGAFTELAKAGLSVEDSLAGAKGVLQLATAAQIDNSQATIIAASALNAFGLSGDKAVHVADLLANAANASQGSISDMGLSLQQAAAVSRQVGVSLEDTVALLTLLAKNGIRGSDAGTSLRVSFTKLINPTAKAAEVLNKLNVNVRDAAGNVRPEVFNDFAAAQADLTRAEQDRNAGIVFGTDALRAYSIISREALGGLDATRAQLDRQGSAAELAGARMSGLTGAAENLKNQVAALGTTLGTGLLPPLTLVTEGMGQFFANINSGLGSLSGFGPLQAFFAALKGNDLDPTTAGVRDLADRMRELADEAAHFQESGGFVPARIINETKDLTAQIVILGKAVEATGSSQAMQSFLTDFMNESPKIAKAFIDGIITPAEKAELATTSLGRAFLKVVPDDVFSGLGAAARDGVEYARTVAGQGIDNMGAHVRSKIEDMSRTAGDSAASAGKNVGDKFVEALASAASRSKLDLALAQADGNEGAELSILRKREQRQEEFLEKVLRRPKTPKNVALATEAAGNLDQTRSAVAAIVDRRAADEKAASDKIAVDAKAAADKRVSDAKAAATKLRTAREKADREVVNAITDRSAAFDTRQTVVEATPGLADDITLARNRKKFLTRQIEIAKDSIKNDELLSDTLRDLRDQRRRQTTKIETLLDEQRQAAVIKAQERRDTVTENIGKQLQIAELRGGKDAILEALNRAIVDSRKRVAEAKKAGKGVLDAQVALETFLAQKREFLKDVEKEAKEAKETGRGTTAFGLLQQFAGRFGEIGGNLINGQQPFAGPTGFTADIAQFLKRQEEGGAGAPATGRGGKKTAFEINDDRLVKALGHLADAIISSGGGKSKSKGGYSQRAIDAMGDRMTEAARFYQERAAKSAVEAGA